MSENWLRPNANILLFQRKPLDFRVLPKKKSGTKAQNERCSNYTKDSIPITSPFPQKKTSCDASTMLKPLHLGPSSTPPKSRIPEQGLQHGTEVFQFHHQVLPSGCVRDHSGYRLEEEHGVLIRGCAVASFLGRELDLNGDETQHFMGMFLNRAIITQQCRHMDCFLETSMVKTCWNHGFNFQIQGYIQIIPGLRLSIVSVPCQPISRISSMWIGRTMVDLILLRKERHQRIEDFHHIQMVPHSCWLPKTPRQRTPLGPLDVLIARQELAPVPRMDRLNGPLVADPLDLQTI